MKKLLLLTLTLLWATVILAQSNEQRNKIELVVTYGGKNISTELNTLSTSLSRSAEDETTAPVTSATDSSKTKLKAPVALGTAFYLTMDAKQISMELLKVFAKKQTRFDGAITITDSYGKNPPRVIKFKQASLYNYSDQFSSASYSDSYGNSVISIVCKEISINGITIEQ